MRVAQVVGTLSILMMLAIAGQTVASERGQRTPTLQIEQAWVRRTPPMASVEQGSHGGSMERPDESALSVIVHNHGHAPEALLAVSSVVATTGELHQTVLQDGTLVMQPQTRFEIPAGGHLAMHRGDAHLMLLGLTQALRVGDTIPVLLLLQHAGPMAIDAVVK